MSQCVVTTVVVTGPQDSRDALKHLFDESKIEKPWGYIWDIIPKANFAADTGATRCMPMPVEDGITVTPENTTIRGESQSDAIGAGPFSLLIYLSERFGDLVFDATMNDLSASVFTDWQFVRGEGKLIGCGDDSTIYMAEGQQLEELPDWVPVNNRSMPAAN